MFFLAGNIFRQLCRRNGWIRKGKLVLKFNSNSTITMALKIFPIVVETRAQVYLRLRQSDECPSTAYETHCTQCMSTQFYTMLPTQTHPKWIFQLISLFLFWLCFPQSIWSGIQLAATINPLFTFIRVNTCNWLSGNNRMARAIWGKFT